MKCLECGADSVSEICRECFENSYFKCDNCFETIHKEDKFVFSYEDLEHWELCIDCLYGD